jgi:hypothetical protein
MTSKKKSAGIFRNKQEEFPDISGIKEDCMTQLNETSSLD